ncbi:MAG: diguanylate cyclase domain-containing protein [Bacillota bacterium]
MQVFYMLMLTFLGFVSFIPVIKLSQHKDYEPFRPLRDFVLVVFIWTFVLLFKFLIFHLPNYLAFAYYLHLFGYVAIIAAIVLFIRTVFHFMGKPFSKTVNRIAIVYVLAWALIVFTNEFTNIVVLSGASDIDAIYDLMHMEMHPFFLAHTFLVYTLLGMTLITLYINLIKRKRANLYRVPRYVFAGMVILAVVFNIIHNFVYTFYLDPSYVAIVVFSYVLYTMIYKRDLGFILVSESRKTLLKNMHEMYFVADDTDTLVDCSDALRADYGITKGLSITDALIKLKDKAVLYQNIDRIEDKSKDVPYLNTLHKTFSPDNYTVKGTLYLFYDESKFVRLVEKLEYLRSYDEMTGLYNRNHFERSIDTLDRKFDTFGVIVSDINGLKLFNDYFGHKAGDDLIIRYSDVLKRVTASYDSVSLIRMGGDEFAIFIGNATKDMLETIKKALHEMTYHENPLRRISISIGSAIRDDGESLEATLLRADTRLYTMKRETSSQYKNRFLKAYEKSPKK